LARTEWSETLAGLAGEGAKLAADVADDPGLTHDITEFVRRCNAKAARLRALRRHSAVAPTLRMLISDWQVNEFGVLTRTITALDAP
jgi:hypothetical protein